MSNIRYINVFDPITVLSRTEAGCCRLYKFLESALPAVWAQSPRNLPDAINLLRATAETDGYITVLLADNVLLHNLTSSVIIPIVCPANACHPDNTTNANADSLARTSVSLGRGTYIGVTVSSGSPHSSVNGDNVDDDDDEPPPLEDLHQRVPVPSPQYTRRVPHGRVYRMLREKSGSSVWHA